MKKVKFILVLALLIAIAYYLLVYLASDKDVKVIFVSGKVYLDNSEKTNLKVGDAVPPEVSVKLDEDAICFLQTPAGGVLKLSSRVSLKLHKADKTSLHMERGTLEYSSLAPIATERPEITTPSGNLELKSEHCLVTVEKKRTTVSVYKGQVSASRGNKTVEVESNHGAKLTTDELLVSRLPGKPVLKFPEQESTIESAFVDVRAESDSGAKIYRWEYSRDSSFEQMTMVQTSQEGFTSLRRPRKDGKFFLRVRTVNANGLVSLPCDPVSFKYTLYQTLHTYVNNTYNFYLNKKKKDRQKAIETARRGLALCPDHVGLQKYLALSLIELGSRAKALDTIDELKASKWPEARQALKEIAGKFAEKYPDDPAMNNWK